MASDKQRLVALEKYVGAMAAYTTGAVVGAAFWVVFLPAEPALLGCGITFTMFSVWEYYRYMEAKYQ